MSTEPSNPSVKYWSKVALNSVTNAFGGHEGHYAATTWHWGKVENVDYHRNITLQVSGGSIWDHDDHHNDNDLPTARWWDVSPDIPGVDPLKLERKAKTSRQIPREKMLHLLAEWELANSVEQKRELQKQIAALGALPGESLSYGYS